MEGALGWLGSLMEALGSLFPRIVKIPTTHAGVKFVCFRPQWTERRLKFESVAISLSPGVHWFWPAVTEVYIWPTNRQTFSLPEQVLRTKDGTTVSVRAIIVYTTLDVTKLFVTADEPEDTLTDICMAAVKTVATSRTLEDLERNPLATETALIEEVRRAMPVKDFGISVKKAFLCDCVPCHALKIWGIPQPILEGE